MNPYQIPSGVYDYSLQHEDISDSLDDFLAQLLADTPEFLPPPVTMLPAPPSLTTFTTSTFVFDHAPISHHGPDPEVTCQWVFSHDRVHVCGVSLSVDPKQACTHFRNVHDIRGNEKVVVSCQWHDCQVPPMQRGSLIRHVLSVHLGLLRWQCEVCGRIFSRKGTGHACADAEV